MRRGSARPRLSCSVLSEGRPCFPGRRTCPLPRWADQVEADGSLLAPSSVLTARPGLPPASWLCETRRPLKTSTQVPISPDGGVEATRQRENGFGPGAHGLRKGRQGLPKTNVPSRVLSVGGRRANGTADRFFRPRWMARSFRSSPAPALSRESLSCPGDALGSVQ